MVLEYADRLFKQKERLKKQIERIRAQSGRRGGIEQRRRIEEKWNIDQKKQTLEQQEKTFEGVREARSRSEAVTSVDALERKKTAKELMWGAKWNTRRARFNVRVRKYG
jgi:hypothetical protein